MKKFYKIVFVLSVITAASFFIYWQFIINRESIGPMLVFLFFGVVIVPLLFGFFGMLFSREQKLKHAFSSLGISFAVMSISFVVIFIFNQLKTQGEVEKAYSDCLTFSRQTNTSANYCEVYKK